MRRLFRDRVDFRRVGHGHLYDIGLLMAAASACDDWLTRCRHGPAPAANVVCRCG